MRNKLYICRCGWISYGVSRDYAIAQVKLFNDFYDTLSLARRYEDYGNKKASILQYERCGCCGACCHVSRPWKIGDADIYGSTVNPIIVEDLHDQRKRTASTKGKDKSTKVSKASLPKA